ncbi:hypothetical protein, partial [Streptomyces sp. NRRL WC-3742]|uniref:hypothetical protein n=1 Tax=Streptomyces sp. NRRL WC-3742 TaxID=1463934 RepID=UPI001F252877
MLAALRRGPGARLPALLGLVVVLVGRRTVPLRRGSAAPSRRPGYPVVQAVPAAARPSRVAGRRRVAAVQARPAPEVGGCQAAVEAARQAALVGVREGLVAIPRC